MEVNKQILIMWERNNVSLEEQNEICLRNGWTIPIKKNQEEAKQKKIKIYQAREGNKSRPISFRLSMDNLSIVKQQPNQSKFINFVLSEWRKNESR